jgi:nitrous oxidase accessory protein NosD
MTGSCAVSVAPGESIQNAIDGLPSAGGCVCLVAGAHLITQPLKISRPDVRLVGASRGAHVVRADGPTLLQVDAPDVVVESIEFLYDNSDVAQTAPGILVELTHAPEVVLRECRVSAVRPVAFCPADASAGSPLVGVRIAGCTGARVERCHVENVALGIMVVPDSTRVAVEGCTVEARGDSACGVPGAVGVLVAALGGSGSPGVLGPVWVRGNRLSGFLSGIVLNDHYFDPTAPPLSTAERSVVEGNEISRPRYTSDVFLLSAFAVDVAASACVVRGNRITVANLGGLWLSGSDGQVEGNRVDFGEAPGGASPGLTYGIVLGHYLGWLTLTDALKASAEARLGFALPLVGTARCRASANEVVGSGFGFLVTDSEEASLVGNRASGAAFGFLLQAVRSSEVSANVAWNAAGGVVLSAGARNRVAHNRIEWGTLGVLAAGQADLVLLANEVFASGTAGVMAGDLLDDVSIAENHLDHCGYLEKGLATSLAVFDCLGSLRVAGNRVVDTSVSPKRVASGGATIGVIAAAKDVRLTDNLVLVHEKPPLPDREHRAVLLLGLGVNGEIDLAPGKIVYAEGEALLQANRFEGPGRPALVEIRETVAAHEDEEPLLFERITFSDNYCGHRVSGPLTPAATVLLRGKAAIVAANHVKGATGVPAVDFQGTPGVFAANISYSNALQVAPFPNPEAGFNR